jgi:hypothetical protein
VVELPIASLDRDPARNARNPDPDATAQREIELAARIRADGGQQSPVLVSRRPDGTLALLRGFIRCGALVRLGATTVRAQVVEGLSPEQEALFVFDHGASRPLDKAEVVRAIAGIIRAGAIPGPHGFYASSIPEATLYAAVLPYWRADNGHASSVLVPPTPPARPARDCSDAEFARYTEALAEFARKESEFIASAKTALTGWLRPRRLAALLDLAFPELGILQALIDSLTPGRKSWWSGALLNKLVTASSKFDAVAVVTAVEEAKRNFLANADRPRRKAPSRKDCAREARKRGEEFVEFYAWCCGLSVQELLEGVDD